jgi:hypothetical protein
MAKGAGESRKGPATAGFKAVGIGELDAVQGALMIGGTLNPGPVFLRRRGPAAGIRRCGGIRASQSLRDDPVEVTFTGPICRRLVLPVVK